MSRLTLRLPETLHQQLTHLAEAEGVSLNQYIVYALTRQASSAYSVQVVSVSEADQQQAFQRLIEQLGQASSAEVEAALATREHTQPETELSSEAVSRLKKRIQNQR